MDMEASKPLANNESNRQTPYYPTDFPAPQVKPLFSLEKGDFAFGICAIVFSVFTAVFGICGGYALGYLISCLFMMGLFTVYFAKGAAVRFFPVLCGILSIANASVFLCTSNGSVRFFGALVSFLLGLISFGELRSGGAKGNRETLGILYTAGATINNVGIAIKSLFVNQNGHNKVIGKSLVGFLCAVPLLFIIVPLLISSDDAFRGMMHNLFGNSTNTLFRAIFGLILSVFVISYGFSLKKERISKAKKSNLPGIENAYIISFLSAICVCYLMYLFSQLAYFFSAFSGFLPDGEITYAQYARKGFFEMCTIAVINLGIVFLALLIAKKKEGKVCTAIKALTTFVAVFTLVIIATAISKMVLYIDVYGMTVLRLTTSAFMVFLGVVFISVILRIYIVKINIVKTACVAAGCILLILGTANVNSICAKYNYESYISGKLLSVDIDAMYQLGDEGIPYLVKLADHENEYVAREARKYLAQALLYTYFEDLRNEPEFTVSLLQDKQKNKSFSYFSIPKAAAYESLYSFIEENPNFASQCKELLLEFQNDFF